MTNSREIELKLEPDASDDGGRLVQGLSRAIGLPCDAAKRLKAVYFDTRKQALRRRGLALRVRSENGRMIQTLKASAGAGTFLRSEWQSDAVGDTPDAKRFEEKTPREILKARGKLRPMFATDVERTVWNVRQGVSEIEVSVDLGEVKSDDVTAPFAEIELELKSGSASDLFGLARHLAGVEALRIGVRSKSDRGFALLDDTAPDAVKAEHVRLAADMTVGEAFQVIARSCVRQFRLNEAILLQTRAADPLHQARVALRRLRSALSLFKAIVVDDEVENIHRGLKNIAILLGEARDLDVYRKRVVDPERARGPIADLKRFELRIGEKREAAYDKVLAALESPEVRMSMLSLAEWIETGPWLNGDNAARDQSVADFAPHILKKRARAIRRKGDHLDLATAMERHEVRIAAKKLRYAGEFFGTLVTGKHARREHQAFVASLENLQETLGALNDLHTGREMAESLPSATTAEPVGAAISTGLDTDEHHANEYELLRVAVAAHAGFAKTRPGPIKKHS